MLGWFLAPICAAFASQDDLASSDNGMSVAPWTEEPRMGEAEKPGPLAGFDDASEKAWSEYEEEAEQLED